MGAYLRSQSMNCKTLERNIEKSKFWWLSIWLRFRKITNTLPLLPAIRRLEYVSIDILGPPPRSKSGNWFVLVIKDRIRKLNPGITLRMLTAIYMAVAFKSHCVFKYGLPISVLSDNGSKFASQLFQLSCAIMGTSCACSSTSHPQTNGTPIPIIVRLFICCGATIVSPRKSRNSISLNWLTHTKHSVHRITGCGPFHMVLGRQPTNPTVSLESDRDQRKRWDDL